MSTPSFHATVDAVELSCATETSVYHAGVAISSCYFIKIMVEDRVSARRLSARLYTSIDVKNAQASHNQRQ